MARAAAPDERIALSIETSYDGSGIRAARQDNTALAKDARAAAQAMATGAQQVAGAQETIAGSAARAAAEQQKVAISTEQSRQMWAQAGGDYGRFLELLRAHVQGQEALKQATVAATAVQQEQAQVIAAAAGSGGNPADSVQRVATEVDKIPGKARTAANSLTAMAFAMTAGGGSARGLAVAAGSAADSISVLSGNARLAAGAAGIGALVTITVAAITMLDRMETRARAAGAAIASTLGNLTGQALAARAAAIEDSFERQQRRVIELGEGGGPLGIDVNVPALMRARAELERLAAAREAIFREQRERARNEGRDTAQRNAEERERALEEADRMNEALTESAADALARVEMTEVDAQIARVRREEQRQLREIERLEEHLGRQADLRVALENDTASRIQLIREEAAKRQRVIDEREAKEQERISREALERRITLIESAIEASKAAGESYVHTAVRVALFPLVEELKALAASHLAKAAAAAAIWNVRGALMHTAAAGLAAAGARQIAQMGGLSGGSPGGNSFAAGGGPSMLSRDPREGAGGDVTVVLQTVNPFSREVLSETTHQLQRSGILKRPTYAPPAIGGYSS